MINRRTFSSVFAAATVGITAADASAQGNVNNSPSEETEVVRPRIRNVVLVHGLYADGSCWLDVISRLQMRGLRATAVQNGLRSLTDDVITTRRILDQQNGPTVLVGHSFGGMIISEAGIHPNVASLVYIAARGPEAGEDYPALNARFPRSPASDGLKVLDGFGQLTEEAFLNDFAGDVDPVKARTLFAVQQPFSVSMASEKTTVAAWHTKPSWFQISRNDRTINPEQQRFVAKRMNATIEELESSHVSMISHPDEVARMILLAAR